MKVPLALLVTVLTLAGLGLANLELARVPVDVSPITGETERAVLGAPSSAAALADREIKLLQASSRPLFAPDRRPWTAPAPADLPAPSTLSEAVPALDAPIPAAAPPELTLIGIQKTPRGAMALVADKSGAAPVWLSDGEDYQDWKIGDITASSATLANGTSVITLELYPPLAGGVTGP